MTAMSKSVPYFANGMINTNTYRCVTVTGFRFLAKAEYSNTIRTYDEVYTNYLDRPCKESDYCTEKEMIADARAKRITREARRDSMDIFRAKVKADLALEKQKLEEAKKTKEFEEIEKQKMKQYVTMDDILNAAMSDTFCYDGIEIPQTQVLAILSMLCQAENVDDRNHMFNAFNLTPRTGLLQPPQGVFYYELKSEPLPWMLQAPITIQALVYGNFSSMAFKSIKLETIQLALKHGREFAKKLPLK